MFRSRLRPKTHLKHKKNTQHDSNTEPRTIPGPQNQHFGKIYIISSFLVRPRGQKGHTNHTKMKKKRFSSVPFRIEKNQKIQTAFFSLFDAPGRSRNPKIQQKRITVVQNSWSQVLMKKLKLFKKCPKMVPPGTRDISSHHFGDKTQAVALGVPPIGL